MRYLQQKWAQVETSHIKNIYFMKNKLLITIPARFAASLPALSVDSTNIHGVTILSRKFQSTIQVEYYTTLKVLNTRNSKQLNAIFDLVILF